MPCAPVNQHESDDDLVGRLRGDKCALRLLYDRHAGFVLGRAWRVTGDRLAAEDVVQEVFLSLWGGVAVFDAARGGFRGYLAMLAHAKAVNLVRAEEAGRRRAIRFSCEPVTPTGGPADIVTASLLAARIRSAVAALPDEERAAVQLAYFGGCTYREVALALGVPEGTIKSRLRKALQRLAGALRPEDVLSAG